MHEQGIAQDIINTAKAEGEVTKITIECGDLGHLPAEEMREVLEKMTNWEITIIKKKAIVKCEKCNFEGEPKITQQLHDHNVFECPECKAMFPKILEGDKIILQSVEIA